MEMSQPSHAFPDLRVTEYRTSAYLYHFCAHLVLVFCLQPILVNYILVHLHFQLYWMFTRMFLACGYYEIVVLLNTYDSAKNIAVLQDYLRYEEHYMSIQRIQKNRIQLRSFLSDVLDFLLEKHRGLSVSSGVLSGLGS